MTESIKILDKKIQKATYESLLIYEEVQIKNLTAKIESDVYLKYHDFYRKLIELSFLRIQQLNLKMDELNLIMSENQI